MKLRQRVIDGVAGPVRSRLFSIAAARKAKWIVAGIWLTVLLGSFALDLPGRFADAEQNENVDYLPASAESTKALGVTERLNDGDVASAIVVYRRDGGLTPADRAAIAADVAGSPGSAVMRSQSRCNGRQTSRRTASRPRIGPGLPYGLDSASIHSTSGRASRRRPPHRPLRASRTSHGRGRTAGVAWPSVPMLLTPASRPRAELPGRHGCPMNPSDLAQHLIELPEKGPPWHRLVGV